MSGPVLQSLHGGVIELRLNRPEKKNALTGEMYETLIAAFDEADKSEKIAAIVIGGEGDCFTAGNDISDFLAHAGRSNDFPALRFIRRLAVLETPLIAAVHGVAIGVGTTMLFHCDLVYAAPAAQFRMPFTDLALVPEAASSLLVPQRFGMAQASAMLLLGDGFDAAQARDLGLLNAIVDTPALRAHAMEQAQRLAAKPQQALRATRRLLRGDPAAILERIDQEALEFKKAMGSAEAAQVFMAFLARSKK